jgi:hypothetical protein
VSVQVDERPTFDKTSVPPDLARSVPYFRITHFNAVRLLSRSDLDERVAEFLAIMRRAPKPIYVQCRTGVDRALVLAAAYRVLIQNMDPRLRGQCRFVPASGTALKSAGGCCAAQMIDYCCRGQSVPTCANERIDQG